jgi:GNAT superfamily N-acetyltransferase
MGRRIGELTLSTLDDLPLRCRGCVFWELSPTDRALAVEHDPEFEKEAWCSTLSLDWGSCGKVAYLDGRPVGFALAGPLEAFPRAAFFPARVSKDALFLAVANVLPEAYGRGVGKALIQSVVKESKDRGKRAVECFADRAWLGPDCMLPADFCERVGFKVKREHPRFPLMRIDLRSLAKLSDQVEAAVEALLESLSLPTEPAVGRLSTSRPRAATPGPAGARSDEARLRSPRRRAVGTPDRRGEPPRPGW